MRELVPRINNDRFVMRGKGCRIIAGIAWVVGSSVAWAIVCNIFSFVVFMYLGNERQVRLPEGIDSAFNWIAVAAA